MVYGENGLAIAGVIANSASYRAAPQSMVHQTHSSEELLPRGSVDMSESQPRLFLKGLVLVGLHETGEAYCCLGGSGANKR